ncbi:hypothetical protein B9479_006523 [Cryptococcus floricola]|uniref:Roadblock/LAMTOR2 domain-containing protein n=1 Tax=Cryptococcus floricola TaxID=2591691 RepID=A0A5D3ART1_9TREE|nr:hypothetical protein B9479_006523 [Cryptococcus floricola]
MTDPERFRCSVRGLLLPSARKALMRIRTKRHELIITPDEKYVLVVLQDPGQ